jgi:outer membrane protein assembly factor BamE
MPRGLGTMLGGVGGKMLAAGLTAGLAAGCTPRMPELPDLGLPSVSKLPLVYRIDVQQGNVVSQTMIAQLHRGMEKKKVQLIMGTPMVSDIFHPDRWDYVYSFSKGGGVADYRRVTLIFEADRLKQIVGDVKAASGPIVVPEHLDQEVEVPKPEARTLVEKISQLGFSDDKKKKPATTAVAKAEDKGEGKAAVADKDPGDKDKDKDKDKAEVDDRETILAAAARTGGHDLDKKADPDKKAAPKGEEVLVTGAKPGGDKGLFGRMLDKIGLGDSEKAKDYDPGQIKHKDPGRPQD